MPESYYREAQKLAQREFRACAARGEHPYLPSLEDFVPPERFGQRTDLGLVSLPAELIVGARAGGRTGAFARNFMPLLPVQSEFAAKWMALCKTHLEEGIRDPVQVYEYMNRFYVEEGNKRVSVLKFFDAVSLPAHVVRILPEPNGSREYALYQEFMEFYQCSRLNLLEFSKPGGYAELQRLLGKGPGERWTDEERIGFSNTYYYFRQAYEAHSGRRLASTVGDAMLTCIQIYGYQALRSGRPADLKALVDKTWEEIALQQEEPSIAVKLAPEEKNEGLLAKILPKGEPKRRKVAFLFDKDPTTSGWAYGHEMGRLHVEQVFRGELETTAYFNAMDGDPLEAIERAVAEGNTVLFTTSPRLLPASLRAAVEHPDLIFLNCSLNKSHRYIRTYYARMYEAKFITGAIAGALAGGSHVGYLCDYPIFGQLAGINAFALGVQMTNPRARVFLEWSAVGGVEAATRRLTDRGISLISNQDLPRQGDQVPRRFGLSLLNSDGQVNLAMPVWQWGVYYESLLRQIQNRHFQTEYEESSKALNYYWGMSAGVIELHCSSKLPDGARKLADLLKDSICAGICAPFRGPLYAQDGRLIASAEQSLSVEQIIGMDWLAENITGAIPSYEELSEIGKATVGIVGVDPANQDA